MADSRDWMARLAGHYDRMRRLHPNDRLLIVLEIDSLIVGPVDAERLVASPRAMPGGLEMIRWFQLQPTTFVALNSRSRLGRREETLRWLNALGRAHRVGFDGALLHVVSLVATEASCVGSARHQSRCDRHRGDRGAAALVGPSRSGKTTAAVSGILEWDGPAVLSSVKADLLGATHGWRSELGQVHIYDPTKTTGGTTAKCSPLQQSGTSVVGPMFQCGSRPSTSAASSAPKRRASLAGGVWRETRPHMLVARLGR